MEADAELYYMLVSPKFNIAWTFLCLNVFVWVYWLWMAVLEYSRVLFDPDMCLFNQSTCKVDYAWDKSSFEKMAFS